MAIVNSIRQAFITGASPGTNVTMLAVATPATAGNITIPIPQPGYFNYGMLRIKSLTPISGTLTINSVSVSDGVNMVQLRGPQPALTLPGDTVITPLVTDIQATSLILNVVASAAGTADIELAAV